MIIEDVQITPVAIPAEGLKEEKSDIVCALIIEISTDCGLVGIGTNLYTQPRESVHCMHFILIPCRETSIFSRMISTLHDSENTASLPSKSGRSCIYFSIIYGRFSIG